MERPWTSVGGLLQHGLWQAPAVHLLQALQGDFV